MVEAAQHNSLAASNCIGNNARFLKQTGSRRRRMSPYHLVHMLAWLLAVGKFLGQHRRLNSLNYSRNKSARKLPRFHRRAGSLNSPARLMSHNDQHRRLELGDGIFQRTKGTVIKNLPRGAYHKSIAKTQVKDMFRWCTRIRTPKNRSERKLPTCEFVATCHILVRMRKLAPYKACVTLLQAFQHILSGGLNRTRTHEQAP